MQGLQALARIPCRGHENATKDNVQALIIRVGFFGGILYDNYNNKEPPNTPVLGPLSSRGLAHAPDPNSAGLTRSPKTS